VTLQRANDIVSATKPYRFARPWKELLARQGWRVVYAKKLL
jgi:hypothetical protein